jgi:hypothetical protein
MPLSRAASSRTAKSRRDASAPFTPPGASDPLDLLARDPFVARCLRRLLAGDRAATTLLSAGVAPTARRAAIRSVRARAAADAAGRAGRVAQPAALADWRRAMVGELDGRVLRRRYPLVLALLEELTDS